MPNQPNILFVLTDQQRWDTIHAANNPHIRTPVMDRLCREGVNFARGYTPSPVCVSARAAIITGQYPHNNGCFDNGFPQPTDRPSLMDCLARAGYCCHGVGKMHFTGDRRGLRGFHTRDVQEELCGSVDADDYLQFVHAQGFGHVHDVMGARGEMYYIPQISQLPARLHPTAWVADRSIDFLQTRDVSKPFFLWSSFIHPHPPFCVSARAAIITGPDNAPPWARGPPRRENCACQNSCNPRATRRDQMTRRSGSDPMPPAVRARG